MTHFSIAKSIEILEKTPKVLNELLENLSQDWTMPNEGADTWSVYDIIGHLIEGEKTDWMPRLAIILSDETNKNFVPFDRFTQFEVGEKQSLAELLSEFQILRQDNLKLLRSKQLNDDDLMKTGIHPAFGEVTLAQLLATWTVHDLNHLAQISRVMAHQYRAEVGPWVAYLGVLNKR